LLTSDVCAQDISKEAHKLHRLGCLLTPSSEHVSASYAQRTVEVPAFLAGANNLAVAVRSLATSSNSTFIKQHTHTCALQLEAELVVSLRPSTDNCVNCTEGRDFVNSGRAKYTKNDANPCDWTCDVGFLLFQSAVKGMVCGLAESALLQNSALLALFGKSVRTYLMPSAKSAQTYDCHQGPTLKTNSISLCIILTRATRANQISLGRTLN
jgi:hypothetical protein